MSENSSELSGPVDPIKSTEQWLREVVVKLNFCPFAGRELSRGTIRIVQGADVKQATDNILSELKYLDAHSEVETTLIVFAEGWDDFLDYLDGVEAAEDELIDQGYEGVYQIATFHPQYQFAGSDANDAENYTNRSPFPMVHLLREESLERAIEVHGAADTIPDTNMAKARSLGLDHMKRLLWQCYMAGRR